jgi:serine/threonine protein kinase
MPGVFHLLRCVGKAVVKHGLRALANLIPLGDVIYDVACDALHNFGDESRDAELRADLEAVAQAPPEQVRDAAQRVVREIAADQPAEVQINLVSYLSQLPAAIRQSLRRPSDPSSTTVPATLSFRQPADLIPFLPARLPHFKAGDRPLLPVEWELVELLGIGGFGEVWKARHLTLSSKKPVALKFCLDREAAEVLRHEASVLDRVMQHGSHRGIVPLLQTYLGAGTPCLEYELVEGGDLAGLIQEMDQRGSPPRAACNLVLNLARTVAFFHRLSPPLVHRDLKPANILVQRQKDGAFLLRVADFGIGGVATRHLVREQATGPSAGKTLPTVVRGAHTPLYASLQQKKGAPPDPRDDVHALGVIWYQSLCGNVTLERPYGKGWRKPLLARGLTEPLLELLQSCMDDEPDERPADAQALAERLQQLPLAPETSGAAPAKPVLPPPPSTSAGEKLPPPIREPEGTGAKPAPAAEPRPRKRPPEPSRHNEADRGPKRERKPRALWAWVVIPAVVLLLLSLVGLAGQHSSWLNQVEMWFSILVRRVIRRGSFPSPADLRTKILNFIDYFNRTLAKPFKWTFTGQVLKA